MALLLVGGQGAATRRATSGVTETPVIGAPAWCSPGGPWELEPTFHFFPTENSGSSAPEVGDSLLETPLMMVLAFRRQSSSCGVSVLPVCVCLFGTHRKRSCPGSLALRSDKYLSAFFYPFECGKWTGCGAEPSWLLCFLGSLLHSPAWVLQKPGAGSISPCCWRAAESLAVSVSPPCIPLRFRRS